MHCSAVLLIAIHLLSLILKDKLGFKLVDKSCNNHIVRFRTSMLDVGINQIITQFCSSTQRFSVIQLILLVSALTTALFFCFVFNQFLAVPVFVQVAAGRFWRRSNKNLPYTKHQKTYKVCDTLVTIWWHF